jgi:transcriptional regulator with XRE-family HTH domain
VRFISSQQGIPLIEAPEFGARLRREREGRGISLAEIADQTKVAVSVLAGLERGDLSRWPSGIFRRAFIRSYAAAVGLDANDTLTEFLRVFPEDGAPSKGRIFGGGYPVLRLALGDAGSTLIDWRRVGGVLIDTAVVLASTLTGYWTDALRGAAAAGVGAAIVWHATGAIVWGSSPGLRALRQRHPLPGRREGMTTLVDSDVPSEGSRIPRPLGIFSMISAARTINARRERRLVLRDRSKPSLRARR